MGSYGGAKDIITQGDFGDLTVLFGLREGAHGGASSKVHTS
jgi:hypothetical protein